MTNLANKLRRGFTLIELLVVIAILGILATIGLSNFQTARIKALDAQRKSDLATVAKSLEAYVNDHQAYPPSNGSNEIECQGTTVCAWGTPFTDGATTYTAALPTDPSGYTYQYISTGTGFTLYAYLQNDKDPAVNTNITQSCGAATCNYKVTSSNIH